MQSLTAQSESLHVFVLVHVHIPRLLLHLTSTLDELPSTLQKLNSGRSDDIDEKSHGDSRLYTEVERVTEVYQKTQAYLLLSTFAGSVLRQK